MPQRTLSYHFSLQSPWSYLGHATLMDIVRRHGLRLVWKPMNLLAVFSESGGLPLKQRHPLRQAYRDIELQRWRVERGLPLNLRPAFWPLDITLADSVIVALAGNGADPDGFVARAFETLWAEDGDLADIGTVRTLLGATGYDEKEVLARAGSDEVRRTYAANGREALEAGVFGAPTFILDGEPFWGQDRLALVDSALASDRAPIRS